MNRIGEPDQPKHRQNLTHSRSLESLPRRNSQWMKSKRLQSVFTSETEYLLSTFDSKVCYIQKGVQMQLDVT